MKHHQVSKRDTYTYIYNYIVFVVATRRHMWKFLLHQTLAESPKMMTCFEAFLRGKVESLSLKMNPFHFPHKAPSTKHSTSGSRNTEADMMLDCSSEELFRLIDLWCCFELEKNEWKTHGHALWLRWPSTYPLFFLEITAMPWQFYLSWMPWVAAVQSCLQLSLWSTWSHLTCSRKLRVI